MPTNCERRHNDIERFESMITKFLFRSAVAAASVLVLAACGGGGGPGRRPCSRCPLPRARAAAAPPARARWRRRRRRRRRRLVGRRRGLVGTRPRSVCAVWTAAACAARPRLALLTAAAVPAARAEAVRRRRDCSRTTAAPGSASALRSTGTRRSRSAQRRSTVCP